MRLLLTIAAGLLAGGIAVTGPATAADTDDCVKGADAALAVVWDGPAGTASVTTTKPLCAGEQVPVLLASYTSQRYLYDATSHTNVTSAAPTVELTVETPGCQHRINVVRGTVAEPVLADPAGRLTDLAVDLSTPVGYEGGTGACAPAPAVTFISACDGKLTATLANGAAANVDAVFYVKQAKDGVWSTIRVPAGKNVMAPRPAQVDPFTIRDNSGRSSEGRWQKPANCSSPSPSASASASASPSASSSPSASPSASVSKSPSASPSVSVSPSRSVSVSPSVSRTPVASGSGSLPKTGPNTIGLVGFAAAMLAIGGGLIFFTRRKSS
ncbi:LPXTG cell wall anchor domain-containing protein [Actinoplanes sp. G11-F43]|uniref:LPXTG cell wall anchor domain-containing protein n=1 Tax=Actinoplanes sp. G11-F43 TaxID=3424130 RepID=UPI003D328473